jgi:hypothetical protein
VILSVKGRFGQAENCHRRRELAYFSYFDAVLHGGEEGPLLQTSFDIVDQRDRHIYTLLDLSKQNQPIADTTQGERLRLSWCRVKCSARVYVLSHPSTSQTNRLSLSLLDRGLLGRPLVV